MEVYTHLGDDQHNRAMMYVVRDGDRTPTPEWLSRRADRSWPTLTKLPTAEQPCSGETSGPSQSPVGIAVIGGRLSSLVQSVVPGVGIRKGG